MGTTEDRNDPDLDVIEESGMQRKYLVLSDEELARGFVRPVRTSYIHDRELGGCGSVTTMGLAIAETYARNPFFYGGTFCASCGDHFLVGKAGQFYWDGTDEKVGT